MSLGDVLTAVGDMTGIRFIFDKSAGENRVFLDFKDLPLSEGIKKILHHVSSAMIYDDMGTLRRVIIVPRGKGLERAEYREGRGDGLTGPQRGGSGLGSSTTANADTPPANESRPSGKGLSEPLKKAKAADEASGRRDPAMDGPPLQRAYDVEGPPGTQAQIPQNEPGAARPDVPPPPPSEVPPKDGPPLDRPYDVDGPPGGKNPSMDGPPKTP
jgi:hypothetical protein